MFVKRCLVRSASLLGLVLLMACAAPDTTGNQEQSAAQSNTVVVAGATGRTGQLVVQQLLDNNYAVRVLVRNADKAADLFGDSVDIRVADITDRAAVLGSMAGASSVISAVGSLSPAGPNSPEFVDYGGVKNLVDAAVQHNVDQFVLVSSMGATHENHPLNAAVGNVMIWKLRGEDHLRASGVDYTVVRPGGLRDDPGGRLAVKFEQGDKPGRAFISREDVAAVCVASLHNKAARNRTFEVVNGEGRFERDWAALFGALQPD